MTSLFLVLMFGSLALVLLDGNWRAGLLITVVIGFLQDPIRKITPNQPSTFVGLVLLAFALTTLVIYEKKQGRIDLRSMFWTVPEILEWIPIFFVVIAAQAMNSFLRFGDIQLMALGFAFYMAPAVAIWAGYEVGCSPKALQKVIITYLALCSLFAISAWLDFRGLDSIFFQEVGEGIQITFEGFFRLRGFGPVAHQRGGCLASRRRSLLLHRYGGEFPTTEYAVASILAGRSLRLSHDPHRTPQGAGASAGIHSLLPAAIQPQGFPSLAREGDQQRARGISDGLRGLCALSDHGQGRFLRPLPESIPERQG